MNGKISNFRQIASVNRYVLTSGVENGLEVIDCNNGKIRFLLNVSKALDVMQVYHQGENVSFISKNGFTKRETPFLNRFEGGMIYTCGLDSAGRRDGYELHGSFHNNSASVTRLECDENGIVVEATVSNSALFGKNLVMKRKIFSPVNADFFEVEDTLVNNGFKEEDYCLLYHVNVGYPMLDKGAKIVAEINKCTPASSWAKENQASFLEMEDSTPSKAETCYYLDLKNPEISLVNELNGKKFTLSYSKDTLPYFLEWKTMASGDYALGLEPCTTILDEEFKYKTLNAGESVKFSLKLKIENI